MSKNCRKRITIEVDVETSEFDDGATWSVGCDAYFKMVKISIPYSMRDVDHDILYDMADEACENGRRYSRVRYA